MSTPLRTLILEDQAADAELMSVHVERAGFAPRWQRVETERDFVSALGPEVDLILADYQLPQYDALRALERVREFGLETPFIIVSGNIGEELAVTAMQRGAADFVVKDRMARLGPAVAQALEQRRLLVENRQARKALLRSEELAKRIIAAAEELTQVVPLYERMSALAHEQAITPAQCEAVDLADAPVREYLESKLGELLHAFDEFVPVGKIPADTPNIAGREALLLAAVQDAVRTLEQTKRSFKSRALGQLRQRLEALVRVQVE